MSGSRASSGISGLDEVLNGGYITGNTYLLSGPPGTGKTTLGWHFLTAGTEEEGALYVTFAEPESSLRANAAATGFDIANVRIVDLSPNADVFARGEAYDLFSSHEVEREPTTARIIEEIEAHAPRRVFVDSMTSLRFLTNDAFQFRRQALSFLRFLAGGGATVVMTSESTLSTPDDDLRFIVDGVIQLEMMPRTWSLAVTKLRGSTFRNGAHGLVLGKDGARVYPRLLPERYAHVGGWNVNPTGIPEFDAMLGGGLEEGSITILSGPTGVGKTTLGVHLLLHEAERGRRVALYTFDERAETVVRRCSQIGMPVEASIASGALIIRAIEPLRYGPDEFANLVRSDVAEYGCTSVMIDSISGYRMTIQGGDLVERLHALGRYLQNNGVGTFLIDELTEFVEFQATGANFSYLADNLIFLRYVEQVLDDGIELKRAIGILKKRLSNFEKSVCAFDITPEGIKIGGRLPMTSLFAPSASPLPHRP